jgi:hypothetical protein
MASLEAEKTELREEGVIQAATELQQDPESKVNPDTVEQTLVEESRKAGSAAYQFDPDASPEDKAAAAEAVRSTWGASQAPFQLAPSCSYRVRAHANTHTASTTRIPSR